MASRGRVVIAGASGFVGVRLAPFLTSAGYEVLALSRSEASESVQVRAVVWDGRSVGSWASELEGCIAVVNLAGARINGRWTTAGRKQIVNSRTESTRAIGAAMASVKIPPKVWINASATGYYGDAGDRELTENSPPGEGFLAETCKAWEAAVMEAPAVGTRRLRLRLGLVLGPNGGVLQPLISLTRAFLGGRVGSGRQFYSWVHREDLCRLIQTCIESDMPEVVNAVSPTPVTNADFMAELRGALHRPPAPPAPALGLRAVQALTAIPLGLALESQRVVSTVALSNGFQYEFERLPDAIQACLKSDM